MHRFLAEFCYVTTNQTGKLPGFDSYWIKRRRPPLFLRSPATIVGKKRPPFSAGAKLPWFSLLRELVWRPVGWGAVGAEIASGEWLRF